MIFIGKEEYKREVIRVALSKGEKPSCTYSPLVDVKSGEVWSIPVMPFSNVDGIGQEEAILTIENNETRRNTVWKLFCVSFGQALISKLAKVKADRIGKGTAIYDDVTVNTSTAIGVHCILKTNVRIGMSCHIKDSCSIGENSKVSGDVEIAERVNIGKEAIVAPGVKIGAWATIAPHTIVQNDVLPYSYLSDF